ncbi:MAG: tyrosine recombinase XerC [Clostridia bacterium]|nr:tyrosine recombinase XerC [Clostridia bacterium]
MKRAYMEQSPMLFREFFGYLETVRGKSPLTVDEYFLDLRSFFRFYKLSHGFVPKNTELKDINIDDVDIKMCADVTLTDVYEFMNYMASVCGNKAAARSRKCSSLRAFFEYLTSKTGKLERNPVKELNNPKLPSTLPKFLSLEQSFDLLNVIDGENKERDYCIIMLFLNCGMRLSELVGINYRDVWEDNRLRLFGKGGKERIVYLNDACVEAIRRYMQVRPTDAVIDKDALFLSKRRKRISPKTVQALVKKYLGEIGLGENGYSVHKLRHTAATLMYQHGDVDIRVLKDILGHESLGTTQIYTHVSDSRMQDAANSNPLAKFKQKG